MNRVRRIIYAEELHRRGIRGKGITAAVMDSGICHHPDYSDRVVCFKDFVGYQTEAYDDASHGSHVTGILGGNGVMSMGRYCGIAPECDLVHLKVLDRNGNGKVSAAIAAMDWVIRNQRKFNIRVLNFSAGVQENSQEEESRLLVEWIERVWDAGIAVVVAAGNMEPARGSVTVPGTSRKVITVGFCDEVSGRHRSIRRGQYSGRGPTAECICKPEITAPGFQVTSCSNLRQASGYYCVKSGSSMATPVVAGAVCLLLSVHPELTNVEVKMRLRRSGDDLGLPMEQQGWGRINLLKFLDDPTGMIHA